MKNILYLVLTISLHLTLVNAQNSGWLVQSSGVNTDLYSVHFEDGLTGWVCGSGGVILKTTTGGNQWISQSSGGNLPLRAIFFTSISSGWCAGDNGRILRTTNGGGSWSVQTSGITESIKCMYFLNSSTGFAAGGQGKILKTTNEGASWLSQTSNVTSDINSIMFTDNNTGWASGNTGKILKTTNAGSQWVINIDHGPISDFYGLFYSTPLRGTAIGRYLDPNNVPFVYYYKTDNGGNWWEYLASSNKRILRTVFFSDSLHGWSAGDSGVVYGTLDKGVTWTEQNSRTFNDLKSLYFVNNSVGYVVGAGGTILKTIHAGYRDTVLTNRRDLGVIPLVENLYQLINAKYRVQFKAPDTTYNVLRSFNNGVSFDTIIYNVTLADTGRYFDGLLLRVKRIKFSIGSPSGQYPGNAGVVKDPFLPMDSIQTRFYGWDYLPPQNNPYDSNLYKPGNRPYQSRSMSISYPTRLNYVAIRSLLNPEDLRKVKVVFTGYGSGQIAYRYSAVSPTNYQYQDMREVPLKVYEIDITDGTPQPRQLNCGFLEFPGASQDNKWEPTIDTSREVLYIFGSDYNPVPGAPYTTNNLLIQQGTFDVMYVWAPGKKSANSTYQLNDEFIIHPYTVTRPEIAPGYPLYYEFQTASVIGIEPISTIIPESYSLKQNYPNPFNPETKISINIPLSRGVSAGRGVLVQLIIYDILGQEVAALVNEQLTPGTYEVTWNGTDYPSGVYFCRLESKGFSYTIKMVLVK